MWPMGDIHEYAAYHACYISPSEMRGFCRISVRFLYPITMLVSSVAQQQNVQGYEVPGNRRLERRDIALD